MICVQFIFKPGTYDDDFHRLDAQIDAYARSLPGYHHVETWHSKEGGLVNAIYYFTDQIDASVALSLSRSGCCGACSLGEPPGLRPTALEQVRLVRS